MSRIGSLPYPGPFSLYSSVDPDAVGTHAYGGLNFSETSSGIIYSERGGFIDLAHVRMTVDWTSYYHYRVREALESRQQQLLLPTNKTSQLRVAFHYPDDWSDLCDADPSLIATLSLRISQELAWTLGAWHEIATWYGYRAWGVIPQDRSAFTYDDTFSHLIGLKVAQRVIEADPVDFEAAVVAALDAKLADFGAVSAEQTDAAAYRVRGRWWDDTGSLRRYLNLSLDGEPQRPWLAPDEPGDPGRLGEPFELPRLTTVAARDFSNFYELRIVPNIFEAESIRRAAGTSEATIDPAAHFPAIMASIREQLLAAHGPDADQP